MYDLTSRDHPSILVVVFFCVLCPPAELWHFSGVLQPHCASVFHQREKEQSGESGGGPGSHGQLGESLLLTLGDVGVGITKLISDQDEAFREINNYLM